MTSIICTWCLKSFGSKGNLNRHVCSVHLNENWDCDMCDKSFAENQNLLRHKRNMHQDQIPKKYKQNFPNNIPKRIKLFTTILVDQAIVRKQKIL